MIVRLSYDVFVTSSVKMNHHNSKQKFFSTKIWIQSEKLTEARKNDPRGNGWYSQDVLRTSYADPVACIINVLQS
jgi:hypothetical protein